MTLPNINLTLQQRRYSEGADLAANSLLEMSQAPFLGEPGYFVDNYEYIPMELPHREEIQVEEDFCSDFVCCGLSLPDLHALLQHYEEYHVKMEDCEMHLGTGYRYEPYGTKRIVAVDIEPQDAASETPSAFDTTIFRTISPAQYPYQHFATKRPKSNPMNLASDPSAINTLRAMLPSVLCNTNPDTSLKLIHSALSSTVNPPRSAKKSDHPSSDEESSGKNSRRYVCEVPGCNKTYKNANGLKYHTLHGHENVKDTSKPHRCPFPNCSKQYKNPNGLKYHVQHHHPGQTPPGRKTTSLKTIAQLNHLEAAVKREQALRAQMAAQQLTRNHQQQS